MTAFADTPCQPWTPLWCAELPTGSEAVSGTAITAATEILWALSGRRFDTCTVTIRPCRRDCLQDSWLLGGQWQPWQAGSGGGPTPVLLGGLWYNLTCGGCAEQCSCTSVSEAYLPAPVVRVISVKIDGTPLVSGAYRVDDHRWLVRTDGGVWPLCNDLGKDDDQVGTWSVTVEVGETLPVAGQLAVGELAIEIMRACLGDDCRLPRNVQQLARQGVTITYPDVSTLLAQGRLGLFLSDQFISAWNPHHLPARAQVYNVDRPPARRTGT